MPLIQLSSYEKKFRMKLVRFSVRHNFVFSTRSAPRPRSAGRSDFVVYGDATPRHAALLVGLPEKRGWGWLRWVEVGFGLDSGLFGLVWVG